MMTPQQLRSSILQLAIQGKLVEQRPEEGTGAELLREISTQRRRDAEAAKKESRAKSAKSAKESRLASNVSCPVEDAPFEIPESWVWVRLEDLVIKEIKRGKSPVYTQQSGTLVFAQKCNTKAGHIDLSLALFLDESKLSKYPKSEFMVDKDIVINSTGNGTLGRVGLYRSCDNPNKLPVVPDSHVTVIRVGENVSIGYVFYGLKHYQPLLEKLCSGSTNQTELSATTVKSLLFPLPPLAEQKRIVAKIEELLPYVERYEKAWSRLEEFNRRFPEDMRKSVLQMAIQGKLVEQRPEEGTGAELLRKILAAKNAKTAKGNLTRSRGVRGEKNTSALSAPPREEISDPPFEIPESWVWVRLGDIADVQLGKMLDKGKNKGTPHPYLANLSVRWGTFDLSELRMMPFTEDECRKFALLPGDVLMCEGGVPGRCAVWREENSPIKYQKAVHRIRSKFLFPDYIQLFFETICDTAEFAELFTGTTIKHLPREKLIAIPIPLPPLAEQKRIVAKLEEILPLCERLKLNSEAS